VDEFKQWIELEINKRGISIADLARAAGLSPGALGNILRGERQPGIELCHGLSKALRVSPEFVFRRAGILPPESPFEEMAHELAHKLELLDEQSRDEVMSFVRFKIQVMEERSKYILK